MEVRPGYKQTEVGLIPVEWAVSALGRISNIERGKFSARPRNDPKFYGGEFPFIQTGDVTRSGGRITTFTQTLNRDGLRVSRLFPKGTLFFTIAANIGDVGIAAFEAACPDSLVAIVPTGATEKMWLLYELASRKCDFESLASPGAQLNINLEKLRPYLVPVPTVREQCAIAAALSDVDSLLAGLDRLIAKKRDLTQAAMQQLLTGQLRLPGFSGTWNCCRFDELIQREHPRSSLVSGDGQSEGPFPLYVSGAEPKRTEIAQYQGAEALVFSDGGVFAVRYAIGSFSVTDHCVVISLRRDAANMYWFFAWFALNSAVMDRTTFKGSGLRNLDKSALRSVEVLAPPLDEQSAIARVLIDMDTELAALEARRDKTRALKQGMMQELLTGRTRLV